MYLEPDLCELPPEKGPCDGKIKRYYFNSTSGLCLPFIYGGCFGNDNNFFSQYLCEQQCSGQLTLYEGKNIIDFFKQIVIQYVVKNFVQ